LRLLDDNTFGISLDETTTVKDVNDLLRIFTPGEAATGSDSNLASTVEPENKIQNSVFARTSEYLSHPTFHMCRSEHEMLRYLHKLQVS
jgi:glycine dehydrogenase